MRTGILVTLLLLAHFGSPFAAARDNPTPSVKRHAVLIKAFQYQPNPVIVGVGETMEWKNADPVPHTVTDGEKSFDSGSIAPGATWKLVTRKAGTYHYGCTLHPNMTATLIVR